MKSNLLAARGSVTSCLQTRLYINLPNFQHNRPMPINLKCQKSASRSIGRPLHIISSPGYLGRCFTNTSSLSSVQSRESRFKNCTLLRKAMLFSKAVLAKTALIWIEIVFFSNISKRKMQWMTNLYFITTVTLSSL